MSTEKNNYQQLQTVKNALTILKLFTEKKPEITGKEVSEILGISSSAVSRLMATLSDEGFITKIAGSHRYRLGSTVLSLSGVLTSTLEIYKESFPFLQQLVRQTGETVHLAVLENLRIVYLHKIESDHPIETLSHLGKSNPLHCTSSGKILSAYLNESFINYYISLGLDRYTPHTITDPETFKTHLKQVKKQGYSIDIEEFLTETVSIAAPIRDFTNKVIASVNIVGPVIRVNQSTIPELIKQVMKTGKDISYQMGYISR